MGTKGHHKIQLCAAFADHLPDGANHHRERAGAGGIRRKHQDTLFVIESRRCPARDDLFYLVFGNYGIGAAVSFSHVMGPLDVWYLQSPPTLRGGKVQLRRNKKMACLLSCKAYANLQWEIKRYTVKTYKQLSHTT